jgi:hypothetical protein
LFIRQQPSVIAHLRQIHFVRFPPLSDFGAASRVHQTGRENAISVTAVNSRTTPQK